MRRTAATCCCRIVLDDVGIVQQSGITQISVAVVNHFVDIHVPFQLYSFVFLLVDGASKLLSGHELR